MNLEKLRELDIETEHGVFSPIYTFDRYDVETEKYVNFKIVKTAQENYEDFLMKKDLPKEEEPNVMQLIADLEIELIKNL